MTILDPAVEVDVAVRAVVLDSWDPDVNLRIRQGADLDGGTAVAYIRPEHTTDVGVSRSVLGALGKSTVSGTPHRAQANWCYVAVWLAAEQIRRLVILEAQRMTPRGSRYLIEAARRAGLAELWLVMHEPLARNVAAVAADLETATLADLDAVLGSGGPPAPTLVQRTSDWHRMMGAGRQWCRDRFGHRPIDDPCIVGHTPDLDIAFTEAGALSDDLAVDLSPAERVDAYLAGCLAEGHVIEGAPTVPWDQLRVFREPYIAAAVVLAAHGASYADLRLRTDAVTDDGTTVTFVDGRTVSVQPAARRFLVAARLVTAEFRRPNRPLLARDVTSVHPHIAVEAVRQHPVAAGGAVTFTAASMRVPKR